MSSDETTGHRLELSQASTRLAQAITAGDADALRSAADDHATALNSQATAMAASIAVPLYGKLESVSEHLHDLATIIANARQADLTWRVEERVQRDAQSTRLYAELDLLITASEESGRGLKKLSLVLDGAIERVSKIEETLNERSAWFTRAEARSTRIAARLDEMYSATLSDTLNRAERLKNVAFLELLMARYPDLAVEAARRAAGRDGHA